MGTRILPDRLSSDETAGLKLIALPFLVIAALVVMPVCMTLLYSLWHQTYEGLVRTVSLDNYRLVFTDPLYRALFLRSLAISSIVTLASVTLAFPVAYYISFHVVRHKTIWIVAITLPFWTSYLLRVFAWKIILGYNGVINSALIATGLIDTPIEAILYNVNSVIITLTHAWAPFALLPIFLSLERIDRSLYDAARDLGDPAWASFFRITLPMALPGIISASLIIFIPTFGDYVTPSIVGGPGGMMIANIIQAQFGSINNWPMGATVSVSTIALVSLIAFAFTRFMRFLASRVV